MNHLDSELMDRLLEREDYQRQINWPELANKVSRQMFHIMEQEIEYANTG